MANWLENKGLFVLLCFIVISHSQEHYKAKPCGVLYSGSFSGQEFSMRDQDQSLNLLEDYQSRDSRWNGTKSIRIAPGCEMKVCNDTYFEGICWTFNIREIRRAGDILSVSCSCARECKCTDIHMKKSSCARGYLKGGCRTCNSMYTHLIGQQAFVPDEFVGEIEALRIRKGCTLTVYPEFEFDGESDIIKSEVVENYQNEFRSYTCECNDDDYEPPVHQPRPASFPPLISIPTRLDDIIKLIRENSNHPGLLAAYKSLRNRRSSKNAYILLLGSTGAGKSSTINLLFDNSNVTKVGDGQSTTTDIHEYRMPVPVDELGIENSELRIIDTPGLGDTRGIEQDAKFLATLDDFLAGHEELKNRTPNVVLIFEKFYDNRFDGDGSNFVKMLRGFNSFRDRITDKSYSNVIFVFTHFCSETKENTRKPDYKLNQFKKVIESYTLFPKPIIITVAENKAQENGLPMVNGYYKLPNREYYPRNLFEKMELVTTKGGDDVGLGVFRTAFRNSDDFNVTQSNFNLTKSTNPKIAHYFGILTNAYFAVEKTEISQLLQHAWNNSIEHELKSRFPGSLRYLQKALSIRNIKTKEDVPRTTAAILELLATIKHDQATRSLMEKGLNLKSPTFQENTIAGYSYNLFKDAYITTTPFQMDDLHQSDIGYLIPKILACKLEPNSKEIFTVFNTRQGYLRSRIQSLGVEGIIANDNFTGEIKPGYNIRQMSFKPDSCSLSALWEIRAFEFVLNDKWNLTTGFTRTVRDLPVFNNSDFDNVLKWKTFFNDYGTHVVKSVYGGGSIEIQLKSDKPCNRNMEQKLFNLINFAEDMSILIDEGNSTHNSFFTEGTSHTLKFKGGSSTYYTNDLTKFSIEEASELLSNWKQSLKYSPSMLLTEMKLVPISNIVKKLGKTVSSEIERVTNLLFKSSLKYIPPKTSKQVPLSRENTQRMIDMRKLRHQTTSQLNRVTLQMIRMKQENELLAQEQEKIMQQAREDGREALRQVG